MSGVGISRGMLTGQMIIRIGIDHLPDPALSPNRIRRSHWGVRSEHSKIARQEAYMLGYAVNLSRPMELVEIQLIFTMSSRRLHDYDNLIAASKPWLDGLVDAGVFVKDDCWHVRSLTASVSPDIGEEHTEIIVKEV